jgi:elongation factor P--beta-lysine ligase
MPGGRPRKTTEGVDEKTLKARTKATDYAEKKRMELYALQLEILDCEQDLKKMKESKKEIKTDIKKYENKTMTPFVMDDLDLPIPKKIYKPKPKPKLST